MNQRPKGLSYCNRILDAAIVLPYHVEHVCLSWDGELLGHAFSDARASETQLPSCLLAFSRCNPNALAAMHVGLKVWRSAGHVHMLRTCPGMPE